MSSTINDQELLLDEKILGEYRLDTARTEQFGQGGQQMNQQKQERPHGPDATGCARRGKTAKSLRVMIRNDNSPGTGSSAYLIENGWYEIVNGQDWSVYAGSMRYDPDDEAIKYDPTTAHGFVIIVKGRLGKPNTRENQLYTPTAVGSLRITAAQGVVLTLESRQGNKFSLNVKTEKLTSAE